MAQPLSTHRPPRRAQRGISMIEILVTMLIISVAMLGAVGLQMQALRMNQGGQFRSQAVFLAGDLAERIEANKDAAIAGSYVVTVPTAATAVAAAAKDCKTVTCTGTELAADDLYEWGTALRSVLPQSTWSVTQTTTGNPSTYTIVINWIDRVANTTYASATTSETFSYTATRTVQQQ